VPPPTRRFTLLITIAAMLAAILPAGARAQAQATAVPPPQPIVIKLDGGPTVQLSDGGGGLPYLGATAPYNAGALVPALTAFHDSGTYDHEITQIDSLADAWVRRQGSGSTARTSRSRATRTATATRSSRSTRSTATRRSRTHHGRDDNHGRGNGNGKRAIVLDIDETSLSNYSAIVADAFTFGPNSQAEATNEIGKAITQTRTVFNDAKARGIAVFFVTGRPESQRAVTEDNLRREGFDGWQGLTLKPVGSTLTTVAYKSGARAAIEQQGFRIVANVGDQYSDLAGGHADRAFKIPNPFYFLP
jgi:predicted secreted acid phosphatase